jgi:hypothetical protein
LLGHPSRAVASGRIGEAFVDKKMVASDAQKLAGGRGVMGEPWVFGPPCNWWWEHDED